MLGKPTLASDHELLNRYFWLEDHEKAQPSLQRVAAFYEELNVTPDIRVLNRLIRFYERSGDEEKTYHYRQVFKQEYSRAIDFMMERADDSYR